MEGNRLQADAVPATVSEERTGRKVTSFKEGRRRRAVIHKPGNLIVMISQLDPGPGSEGFTNLTLPG